MLAPSSYTASAPDVNYPPLSQIRDTKPSSMAAPYDYSTYSAMDPHVLQMADIGAGYWGAGAPSYPPLDGLPSYPPLTAGAEVGYSTGLPAGYPSTVVPPVSTAATSTNGAGSSDVLEIGKSSVPPYPTSTANTAAPTDALTAMYQQPTVWPTYPGYMPGDEKSSTPGGSTAYPTLPLPYPFQDGSDLSHPAFYPAQVRKDKRTL
ncbi:unnamed protein product [Nippostrongylus brasiliensis]|uniref:YTH domain-containing protein n=1 Tax=Nippostrongylus brasiliensis TaxID=27835 RepID=A0A0N4YGG6_NIPBR|nr:unnamed protein product [Nippostrongylus brasiliensis]